MKKVIVLSNDSNFENRIISSLDKSIFEIINPKINVYELYNYSKNFNIDIFVIETTFLGGYYQIFDMLLYSEKQIVIYVSKKMEIGLLANYLNNPLFHLLRESRINSLNDIIEIMDKNINLIKSYKSEIALYKDKIDEENLIRKSKALLMKKYSLSEADAYKYILKQSMDLRITKKDVAKKILEEITL